MFTVQLKSSGVFFFFFFHHRDSCKFDFANKKSALFLKCFLAEFLPRLHYSILVSLYILEKRNLTSSDRNVTKRSLRERKKIKKKQERKRERKKNISWPMENSESIYKNRYSKYTFIFSFLSLTWLISWINFWTFTLTLIHATLSTFLIKNEALLLKRYHWARRLESLINSRL